MKRALYPHLFCILINLFGLVSCSTPESRSRERSEAFSSMSDTSQSVILKGEIEKGISMDAVYIALGPPARMATSIENGVKIERWIYTRMESEEIPGWQDSRPETFDSNAPTYHHYSPIKLTHPRDHFEVKFEDGKVISWRDL